MKVNKFQIVGRSVSGYATAITLPEYGLSFDCGMATHATIQCPNVVITHGHMDHFGGIARHAYIRGMTGMPTPTYFVPPWLKGFTHQTFKFWSDVQEARMAPFNVEVVEAGNRAKIGKGRFVRPFLTDHRVRSQGYLLFEERKRLKPEFVGTEGRELGRMRREGIEFEDTFEVPLVAFTGDTRASIFDDPDLEALKAKVLIVECTFLPGDVDEAEAVRKGHVHLDQLVARADKFDGVENIVLCHFSKRYSNGDVEAAIANLPAVLREKTTYLPVGK